MRSALLAVGTFILSATCPPSASAGPLDDVRSEVHADAADSSPRSGSGSDDDEDDGENDGPAHDWNLGGFEGCAGCGGVVVGTPAYLPHPYDAGIDGYIARSTATGIERPAALRLAAESSYQYGGLWRVGLGTRASWHWLELDSEWSFYRDTTVADSLWIGDANLGLAPLRRRHLVWHVGGGARFLIDSKPTIPGQSGNAWGWNATTGIDVFPFDPVVLSGEADIGRLGHAWLWRVRGSIGIQLSHAEIFAGYDHLQVGAAALGGPMLGLRIWL